MERQQIPPLSEGDEFTATCNEAGSKGDGIVKHKGFVIFVQGATPGKTYSVKVTKVGSKCGWGRIVKEN